MSHVSSTAFQPGDRARLRLKKKIKIRMGAVAHAYNPSTWEAEAGGSPGLEMETILVNKVRPPSLLKI